MGIQIQRRIDAAFQSLMYDKVESVQMLDLITLDPPVEQHRVCLFDSFGGQLCLDLRIEAWLMDPQVD